MRPPSPRCRGHGRGQSDGDPSRGKAKPVPHGLRSPVSGLRSPVSGLRKHDPRSIAFAVTYTATHKEDRSRESDRKEISMPIWLVFRDLAWLDFVVPFPVKAVWHQVYLRHLLRGHLDALRVFCLSRKWNLRDRSHVQRRSPILTLPLLTAQALLRVGTVSSPWTILGLQ